MPNPEKIRAYIPIANQAVADLHGHAEAMRRILAGEPLPPSPPAPTTPPSGHLRLLDATDGPLRAVVELHAPVWGGGAWSCEGCDFGGYDGEPPLWPCSTVELIAEQLDVDLREGSDD